MNAHDLARAACRGQVTREHDPWAGDTDADVAEAQAVCARCPVAAACAVDGAAEQHLVWAGVLRRPDVSMVVAEPARVRVTVASRHGSRGRYAGGCRCEPCTAANTAYAQHYRHDGPAVTRAAEMELFEQMTIGA